MNSTERVSRAIRGESVDRTPVYGWIGNNMPNLITEKYGSVAAFEDKYEFDMAHIFGGPGCYNTAEYDKIRASGEELTPDKIVDIPLLSPDNMSDYEGIVNAVKHHKQRDRFCYIQTPGFFEAFNGVFGIENQLCYLAEYEEEIKKLYSMQCEWNKRFAEHCIELGLDMIHTSDDWGAQNSLMFSPKMWYGLIYENLRDVVSFVHKNGCFASLHSDGNISQVLDGVADIGIDAVHPYQESAGMSYDVYLEKYSDKFAILGGLCIQTVLGYNDYERLEKEIRRVFGLLKGKRWMFCTTHFVQDHCSLEEFEFAYDLVMKLR